MKLLLSEMFFITMFIFAVSLFAGSIMVHVEGSGGCQYKTIFSRINLGYVIGCELARPRFEPYK